MPLQDHFPVIDDRTYADLVNELKARIPRYVPEWTNYNDSDPGIALIQLFSWLSEMMLYRMNKVPKLTYLSFLEMLGIELRAATPSQSLVSFEVKKGTTEKSVVIPKRTQIAAESDELDSPLIFETDKSLTVLSSSLTEVQLFDTALYTLVTDVNSKAQDGFHPFGYEALPGSALLLGFSSDHTIPDVKIDLTVIVPDTLENQIVQCGRSSSRSSYTNSLSWEYWDGSDWESLNLLADYTCAFTQSGIITLQMPVEGDMQEITLGKSVDEKRYWIRAVLNSSIYDDPPEILTIRTNTVEVTQAKTVQDEVLGGSDGSPSQILNLAYYPVIDKSLTVEVDEGDGFIQWKEVPDFYGAGPEDLVYRLNRSTGEVTFGDGKNGKIPVGNVKNPVMSIIAREYRYGGGSAGNVAVDTITSLMTNITGIDDSSITNIIAAHSGRDEETIEETIKRVPAMLKSNNRAVTAEDFEAIACTSSTVRRAKALPGYHPEFSGTNIPGVVTVLVVPDVQSDRPQPSRVVLEEVCSCLNEKRLLTTEVYVVGPTYLDISIKADIIANPMADLLTIKEQIEKTLAAYFHPFTGGDSKTGWPFGGDVYYSIIHERILSLKDVGVSRVKSLIVTVDETEYDPCTDIQIPEDSLLWMSDFTGITVSYDES